MRRFREQPATGCPSSSSSNEFAMATPELHRSGRRQLGRKPLAFITKALICAALAVAFWASGPQPAGADPDPGGSDPGPFGGLSCSCRQSGPAGGPAQRAQIIGGIQQGLSVGQRQPNLASSPAKPPAAWRNT